MFDHNLKYTSGQAHLKINSFLAACNEVKSKYLLLKFNFLRHLEINNVETLLRLPVPNAI